MDEGDYIFSTFWKSSFNGGAGGGTGNQNYAARFDFGLSDDLLFSIYLSEADDPLYQAIEGQIIPNNWIRLIGAGDGGYFLISSKIEEDEIIQVSNQNGIKGIFKANPSNEGLSAINV